MAIYISLLSILWCQYNKNTFIICRKKKCQTSCSETNEGSSSEPMIDNEESFCESVEETFASTCAELKNQDSATFNMQ